MARNKKAGTSTGKSKSAKYFAKNPKAKANKNKIQKAINKKPSERKRRAELNKENRKRGTYGNGDGKDVSHKKGKVVGLEKASANRARNGKGSTSRVGMKYKTRKKK